MSTNLTKHDFCVDRPAREKQNGHKGLCIFFTGLSGSGKSTIASEFQRLLHESGTQTCILDGDNTRLGLCSDLSFSDEDRSENLRRIAEVNKLFIQNGLVCISTFIAPLNEQRELIKNIIGIDDFTLIFIDTDLETCKIRDPKGLYAKAMAGEIKNFTGIDSKYERPDNADFVLNTLNKSPQECAQKIMNFYLAQLNN